MIKPVRSEYRSSFIFASLCASVPVATTPLMTPFIFAAEPGALASCLLAASLASSDLTSFCETCSCDLQVACSAVIFSFADVSFSFADVREAICFCRVWVSDEEELLDLRVSASSRLRDAMRSLASIEC